MGLIDLNRYDHQQRLHNKFHLAGHWDQTMYLWVELQESQIKVHADFQLNRQSIGGTNIKCPR